MNYLALSLRRPLLRHAARFSGGQRVALKYQRPQLAAFLFGPVFQTFTQHLLGMQMAFSAAGAHTQVFPQLRHRVYACLYRVADFTIGDVLADADNH